MRGGGGGREGERGGRARERERVIEREREGMANVRLEGEKNEGEEREACTYTCIQLTFSSASSNFLWKVFCSLSAYTMNQYNIILHHTHMYRYMYAHCISKFTCTVHVAHQYTYSIMSACFHNTQGAHSHTISLMTFKSFSALCRNSSIYTHVHAHTHNM